MKTFRFRKERKLFFIVIYGLFIFWAVFLGPYVIDLILPDIIKVYGSALKTILHPIVEYSFLMIFLIFIIYPLLMLYRRLEIGIKDIVLSSPAKPGDIFLGEFLGQLPFYILIVLGIGPLGTSIIIQINPNLTFSFYLLFYFLVFFLIAFALLIGNVIANWLEHKLLSRKRNSYLNNLLFTILPFMIILALYVFHFIFELLDKNPTFKIFTNFIPSFWYSNITLHFIDPSLVNTYFLNVWLYLLLIIGVPLLFAYFSYIKANIFYELEKPIRLKMYSMKLEGFFIKIIKKITPKHIKLLVITQFKEFIRKRENVNKTIFLIALNIVFGVFVSFSLDKPLISITHFTPTFSMLIIEVLQFNYSIMLLLAWMGGLTFGVFMGIYVFINNKEIVLVYKKSIRSVTTLVFSFLYNMFIICIILGLILTAFFSIIFLLDILSILCFFFAYLINSMIILTQAIGIQCIRPLYEERGKFIYFNIYIIGIFQVLSFFVSLIIFIFPSPFINYTVGLNHIILINTSLSLAIALLLLTIGIVKLNRTE